MAMLILDEAVCAEGVNTDVGVSIFRGDNGDLTLTFENRSEDHGVVLSIISRPEIDALRRFCEWALESEHLKDAQ